MHGNLVATGEEANRAHLWDIRKQQPTPRSFEFNDGMSDIGFSMDGNYLLLASQYDNIRVYNTRQLDTPMYESDTSAKLLSAGRRLVSHQFYGADSILLGYSDRRIELWDIKQRIKKQTWHLSNTKGLAKESAALLELGKFNNKYIAVMSSGEAFELLGLTYH